MTEKKKESSLSLSAKAKKFGVSLSTLKKVYKRGVAAWNSGHRPGTTPQQWGHARVNSFLRKGKTYHTADKDLREDIDILFERMMFLDADPDQAAAAAEMEKSGKSAEEIWKRKGAFKDPYTGKWTKEISDKEMDIPNFKSQMGLQSKKVPYKPAQAAIKHDALFKNVPGVKSTQVSNQSITPVEKVFGNVPYGGIFRPGSSPSLRSLSVTKKGALDILAHELQHNVDSLQGNLKKPGYDTASFNKSKTSNLMRHSVDPNEIRANATMARRELDTKQRQERFPLKDYKLGGSIFGGKIGIPLTVVPKSLREMQLVGTDEYRQHAIAMTPGQDQEIENAFPFDEYGDRVDQTEENAETNDNQSDGTVESGDSNPTGMSFRAVRKKLQEQEVEEIEGEEDEGEEEEELEDDGYEDGVDFTPNLKTTKPKKTGTVQYASPDISGMPVLTASSTVYEQFNEAIEYHQENNISLVENVYRPGSEMFFAMILEAKRLYAEGNYTPKDEYEQDLLESDIGEVAEYEGKSVLLDFPIEEQEINEEGDPTKGKGIGKPFRSGSGGAVYVRSGKGNIVKVNFSQSGMKKRYNEPARVKSFMARHHCLTNKDRTSASYWACRWPRYFSNTGQRWW